MKKFKQSKESFLLINANCTMLKQKNSYIQQHKVIDKDERKC